MTTVLVVDDYSDNLDVVCRVLEKIGYRVAAASNGDEAIRHCQESQIDILIADVFLPTLSGVQLAALVHEHCPDSAILFISGTSPEGWPDADFDLLKSLMPLRADFLPKPFIPKRLLAKLETLMTARDPSPEFHALLKNAQRYRTARP